MVSESRKVVLMGLFVGAVAIAAYISQADKSWLSSDELGLERDSGAAHQTRSDTMTGSVSSGPVAGRSGSAAAIAGDLRAARDSLQRNDLASAQAQLDAVRAAHRDDDQVLALQREVEARAELVQHALAPAQGEKLTRQGSKLTRSSLASSGKTGRSHESYVARHEHANRGSGEAKLRRGTGTAGAAVGAVRSSQGRAGGAGASVVASSSSSGLAEVKVVSKVTGMAAASQVTQTQVTQTQVTQTQVTQTQATQAEQPVQPARPTSALSPGSQAELTAQTEAAPSSSSPQIVSSAGTQLKTEGGPKTRAQVRAEIARARADGSLPAFGNPDPAGPGGAPSLTTAPRP
ncbi:DUF4148 domain-containing protein [Paraburkholderia sp. RL17-337-BIB-A]|uniref:DUF4148 domain-containing protein n=1 Tax=Paraburkholderia sp. RL17-337-BIB-A TaxID=3031636 RepID=UPI0038B98E44